MIEAILSVSVCKKKAVQEIIWFWMGHVTTCLLFFLSFPYSKKVVVAEIATTTHHDAMP
ncbi:MAG: hypothetical protein SOR58_09395 [Megasphaera massiliensis]|uniref:hypothetical protein n=1 Tax=Megasphaera massiliensis TaxID=1232428 RepID=UPI002A761088|nr:hypothetical protein [Megasphaera massiliensis]MDY2966396.1 hypothetical protein [Megasphaera massiliensis]